MNWQMNKGAITMCEYMRVQPSIVFEGEIEAKSMPMCEYTKDRCTFCICGNHKTYDEAKRSDNNG